jgi:TonB family protein
MSLGMHLWQSTLCVGLAALLAFGLKRAPARTRYTIWLCASAKFLIPFSVLVAAGSYIDTLIAPLTTPQAAITVRWLTESLSVWNLDGAAGAIGAGFQSDYGRVALLALGVVWALGVAMLVALRWTEWRDLSRLARAATRLASGREAEMLQRVTRTSPRPRRIQILQCESSIEPGILGIFRPRLLWPAGLSDRLTDCELDAVLSHEACHVDRGDNLSALLQVAVETAFWLHPAVWWVGARLVGERERACDEEVLRMGIDERSYAEGILKVCGFGLRSPAAFVAGVGGSTLTARIERILLRRGSASLPVPARMLLACVLIIALGGPLVAGALGARAGIAPGSSPSSARQDKPTVYRPGGGVKHPRLVTEVKPQYTPEAMEARIQGTVRLEAVVLDTGEVGDVEVTESLDTVYGLDDEAVRAIRQWRFEPGTKDGKPVAVRIEVEMSFKLK